MDALANYDQLSFKQPVLPALTKFIAIKKQENLASIPDEEAHKVSEWLQTDLAYLKSRELAALDLEKRLNAVSSSETHDWLGPFQASRSSFKLRSDKERAHARAAGKRGPLRAELPNRRDWVTIADQEELLVPVRVEFEHEHAKLRDTFTWNMRDNLSKVDVFVHHLMADMQLPQATQAQFKTEILSSINDSLSDARSAAWEANVYAKENKREESDDDGDEPSPKRLRFDTSVAWTLDELVRDPDLQPKAHDELRIIIKLDITVDTVNLVDQIEWDLSDQSNSPEDFAQALSLDLGLNGEFTTAIAHSIREQLDANARSLAMIGHQPGAPVVQEDLRNVFLGPVTALSALPAYNIAGVPIAHADSALTSIRPPVHIKPFTPTLDHLSPDQILHLLKEREREARRKRRNTKGRQRINLPDRDPVKTYRTLMPRPGGKEPTFSENKDGDQILGDFDIAYAPKLLKREACHYFTPEEADLEANMRKGPRYKGPDNADSVDGGDQGRRKKVVPRTKKLSNYLLGGQGSSRAGSIDLDTGTPVNHVNLEAIGQHPCMIDGKWHCSNCGGPDGVVQGRRKGPAGDKTLCGPCGKHYSRYRRNRPCEYTTAAEKHLALLAADQEAERIAARPHHEPISMRIKIPAAAANRADTPLSDVSPDESEDSNYAPLAEQPVAPPPKVVIPLPPPRVKEILKEAPSIQRSASSGQRPPDWMLEAAAAMRAKYADDKFEIIAKATPATESAPASVQWRIRCVDCPGKLYTTGPEQSFSNFEVHLRNRVHRGNVAKRINGDVAPVQPAA